MIRTGYVKVRIDTNPKEDGWCFCTPASHPDDIARELREEWDDSSQFYGKIEHGAAVSEWQPIETAPHEVNVLLAWSDSTLAGGWKMEAGMASWGWRRGGVSNMSEHGQATHWMPLPEPPK